MINFLQPRRKRFEDEIDYFTDKPNFKLDPLPHLGEQPEPLQLETLPELESNEEVLPELENPETSALEMLKKHVMNRPQRQKPGLGKQLLSGLAAALVGASSRDAAKGAAFGQDLLEKPHRQATEDWMLEGGKLKDLAAIEERSNLGKENIRVRSEAAKEAARQRDVTERRHRETLDETKRYHDVLDKNADATRDATTQARREAAAARKAAADASNDKKTNSQVDRIVAQFDAHPITKRFTIMQEGRNFAKSLKPDTKNPADDQGLLYAFAKIMDPESVVREGEYATVQKYSQAWAETFGFNVQRILSNQEFLTPQARANLKNTIETKYGATKNSYKNLAKEFGRKINRHTRSADGEDYLVNYSDFDDKFDEAY